MNRRLILGPTTAAMLVALAGCATERTYTDRTDYRHSPYDDRYTEGYYGHDYSARRSAYYDHRRGGHADDAGYVYRRPTTDTGFKAGPAQAGAPRGAGAPYTDKGGAYDPNQDYRTVRRDETYHRDTWRTGPADPNAPRGAGAPYSDKGDSYDPNQRVVTSRDGTRTTTIRRSDNLNDRSVTVTERRSSDDLRRTDREYVVRRDGTTDRQSETGYRQRASTGTGFEAGPADPNAPRGAGSPYTDKGGEYDPNQRVVRNRYDDRYDNLSDNNRLRDEQVTVRRDTIRHDDRLDRDRDTVVRSDSTIRRDDRLNRDGETTIRRETTVRTDAWRDENRLSDRDSTVRRDTVRDENRLNRDRDTVVRSDTTIRRDDRLNRDGDTTIRRETTVRSDTLRDENRLDQRDTTVRRDAWQDRDDLNRDRIHRDDTGRAGLDANRDVNSLIQGWPEVAKKAAEAMIAKYGQPDETMASHLLWRDRGQFKKIEVFKDAWDHDFPAPHKDVLQHTIALEVDPEKADDLLKFDGSLVVKRTPGELAVRCDKEEMNILALNLAKEILDGKKSVDEARDFYAKTASEFKKGDKPEYTQRLMFSIPTRAAAFRDQKANEND